MDKKGGTPRDIPLLDVVSSDEESISEKDTTASSGKEERVDPSTAPTSPQPLQLRKDDDDVASSQSSIGSPPFSPRRALMTPIDLLPKKLQPLVEHAHDKDHEMEAEILFDGAKQYMDFVDSSKDDGEILGDNQAFDPSLCDKDCCRCGRHKCSMKECCCWKIPFAPIRLVPFIFYNIVFSTALVVFYFAYPELRLDGVTYLRYMIFFLALLNSFYVLYLVMYWGSLVVRTCCFQASKTFLVLTEMTANAAAIIWAIVWTQIWIYILGTPGAQSNEAWRIITGTLVLISCGVFVQVLATKMIIAKRGRTIYTTRIHDSFYKEKVLEKLWKRRPLGSGSRGRMSGLINGGQGVQLDAADVPIGIDTGLEDVDRRCNCCGFCQFRTGEHFDIISERTIEFERMRITVRADINSGDTQKWQSKFFDPEYVTSADARVEAATIVGTKLFNKLCTVQSKNRLLKIEDFIPFFSTPRKAKLAYMIFNRSSNQKGFVSQQEMIDAVKDIYEERWNLARSLRNRKSIKLVLSRFLGVVVSIIAIICFFFVIGLNLVTALVPYMTLVLGLSFIFGDMLKNTFNSFVFLFFVNPYDVGDMVALDDTYAFIDSISLITTKVYYLDGRKAVLFNANLLSRTIPNYTRSKEFGFVLQIHVDMKTETKVIRELRQRLLDFPKKYPQTWKSVACFVNGMEHSSNLVITVYGFLKGITWAIWAQNIPRTEFYLFVHDTMNELGIIGHLVPQPVDFKNKLMTTTERIKPKEKKLPLVFQPVHKDKEDN